MNKNLVLAPLICLGIFCFSAYTLYGLFAMTVGVTSGVHTIAIHGYVHYIGIALSGGLAISTLVYGIYVYRLRLKIGLHNSIAPNWKWVLLTGLIFSLVGAGLRYNLMSYLNDYGYHLCPSDRFIARHQSYTYAIDLSECI